MVTETRTAHTPGPWEINSHPHYRNGDPTMVWGPDGPGYGAIADAAPYGLPAGQEAYAEVVANARLIAAAPELLDSLDAILNWAAGATGAYNPLPYELVEDALSAIAKAKGKK